MEIFFTLCASILSPRDLSHHLSFSGISLHPPVINSFSFLELPPNGIDIVRFASAHSGCGLAREWPGTPVNPFKARTSPGGTVMRPTLKQSRETTTVCNVAPSGSSPIRPAATALSSFSVSDGEEPKSPGVVVWNGVLVNETASAPGVCRDMVGAEEASPVGGEVGFVAKRSFFPSDLRTHFDMI